MEGRSFTTYAETRDYLYSLKHRGAFYGIDRMRVFTEHLGSPQLKYPTIHVAGTNGKGSTCAMLEAIFREHGYRTGLFTSPHLVHQGERVQVNRENLSHDRIVEFTNKLKPIAEKIEAENVDLHPTFFEFMTGMAFMRFAEAEVDIAIIETGLGGRLDATNVLAPEVCVITTIGLDHTEILGDTYEAIAKEKAGILKPGVPVVIGYLPSVAETVISEKAKELNCPLTRVQDHFKDELKDLPNTSLKGDYQRRNAAVALTVVKVISDRFSLGTKRAEEALNNVSWAGRWDERIINGRRVIFDSTHNPEGALELDRNLADFVAENGVRPLVVAGTLGEARALALVPVIERYAEKIIFVKPKQPRACENDFLRSLLSPGFGGSVAESTVEELFSGPDQINIEDTDRPILITGSIYLIGEILDVLSHPVPIGEQILQD